MGSGSWMDFFANTRRDFSEKEVAQIWKKGKMAQDRTTGTCLPDWHFDEYGALMHYADYGNRNSEFGWEIDHIDSNPSNNNINNLRPLFWRNNCARNAQFPEFYAYNSVNRQNRRR